MKYPKHADIMFCMHCGSSLVETHKVTHYDGATGDAIETRWRKCPKAGRLDVLNSHADLEWSDILGWYDRVWW